MFHNPNASVWKPSQPRPVPQIPIFHQALPDYAVTPLHTLPSLATELGVSRILLKDESQRLGLPAFKILGASWAIYKALPLTSSLEEVGAAARQADVRLGTCTEGNWGRAVARMARYLRIRAVVFVPEFMDEATRRRIQDENVGVAVVVVDGDYDVSIQRAREEAESGGMLVMDVAWNGYEEIPEWVVEGYSTMLTEVDEQLQDASNKPVTRAIVSVGVGSWAQAVAMHYKAQPTPVTIITVEPDTAASLKTSLEAGTITPITTRHTIMNGMNCGTTSTTAWKVLKEGVDVSVAVSDIDVHRDLQSLHGKGIEIGPCGAAPLTALKQLCKEGRDVARFDEQSVVILFSTEGMREYVSPPKA